ncbi:MAG: serine/threonine-protein kinase [Pseudomonadota bacterium]
MTQTGGLPVCPACAYDIRDYHHHPLYLTPHTRLKEQYRIGKVLGQGGFGITYIGIDERLDKRVAIKEYLPSMLATRDVGRHDVISLNEQEAAFEKGLRSFIDEARNLAKFDHSNIVRVLNYFEENKTGYMVMEYLEGESPVELVKARDGHMPLNEALDILLPILDALQTVHTKHVYHLDVSAHNIRFDKPCAEGGKPILIDFGAAKSIMGDYSHSMTLVLKPGYSPLEQYADSGRIGPWTDIYACGALLYLMLTGSLPPAAPERFYEDRLWSSCEQRGMRLPEELKAILDRAMSVKIEERYNNIATFAQALINAADGDAETPGLQYQATFSHPTPGVQTAHRGPLYATAMITITALIVAGWLMRDVFFPNGAYLSTPGSFVQDQDTASTPELIEDIDVPLITSGPSETEAQIQIANLLEKGRQAFDVAQFQEAYRAYKGVINIDSQNTFAQQALSQILEHDIQQILTQKQRGDWSAALIAAQNGLGRFPEDAELQTLHQELTDPEQIRQNEIGALARKAEAQLAALKLTSPTGDNAYETYQQILELMPDAEVALTGLDKLAERYLVLAQDEQNIDTRLEYVNKGLNIAPTDSVLLALKQKLLEEQEAQPPLTLAALQPVTPPVTRNDSIQKFLSAAGEYLDSDDLTRAYNNYRNVLALDEDNTEALSGLKQVADRYAHLATEQQEASQLSESLVLIAQGLTAWPEHQALLTLQMEITKQLDARELANNTDADTAESTIRVTPSF